MKTMSSINTLKFYACLMFMLGVVTSTFSISLTLALMNIGLVQYVLSTKQDN